MTLMQLEQRVGALERKVEKLMSRTEGRRGKKEDWWREQAGRFRNDPVFDEIVRLGKAYRKSLDRKGR